jgi:hypothetical protein
MEVTIPRKVQFSFPSDRDIFIVMDVHWTNDEYSSVIDSNKTVFQNIVNKVRFQSTDKKLIPQFTVSESNVQPAIPLTLNASNSFVSNVRYEESRRNLTYTWYCPEITAKHCESKTPLITIPWLDVYNAPNMTFEKDYVFTVNISWISEDKIV